MSYSRFIIFSSLLGISTLFLGLSSCTAERTLVEEDKRVFSSDEERDRAKIEDKFCSSLNMEKGPDGTLRMGGDKRSDFESKAFSSNGKSLDNKSFETSRYDTKNWSEGKQNYSTKNYGSSDKKALGSSTPYFVTKQAEAQNKAFQNSKEFDSNTADISHDSWSQSSRTVERTTDKARNKPDIEPDIIPFRDYVRKSVEETNNILGRNKDSE